jgi:putative ABC transport system permease protein
MEVLRRFGVLKNNLLSSGRVLGVAGASAVPPNPHQYSDIHPVGDSSSAPVTMKNFFVTNDFIKVVDMNILEGRDFSDQPAAFSNTEFILNEEAVKSLGLKNPLGTVLYNGWGGITGTVIAVVRNFHFKSVRDRIEPAILTKVDSFNIFNMVIRIAPNQIPETLSFIENEWRTVNPDWPFVYHFADQDFQNLYRKEHQTGKTITFFSIVALFLSCFGLFGLVSYLTESRNKEIGIRKINGASVKEIIFLISGNFFTWILTAFIISSPVAYYIMRNWLQNFAYRIEIHWWVFAIAGLSAVVIAAVSISYKTLQAAGRNPVEILRYE